MSFGWIPRTLDIPSEVDPASPIFGRGPTPASRSHGESTRQRTNGTKPGPEPEILVLIPNVCRRTPTPTAEPAA